MRRAAWVLLGGLVGCGSGGAGDGAGSGGGTTSGLAGMYMATAQTEARPCGGTAETTLIALDSRHALSTIPQDVRDRLQPTPDPVRR